jgi:hypothetical protein
MSVLLGASSPKKSTKRIKFIKLLEPSSFIDNPQISKTCRTLPKRAKNPEQAK